LMNALSCLLFPNSIGRIETGTEATMPDLRRMSASSYHARFVDRPSAWVSAPGMPGTSPCHSPKVI
jgi:hypothetical protein